MRSRLFNAIVIAGASMTGGCDTWPVTQPDGIAGDMALDAFRCMGLCLDQAQIQGDMGMSAVDMATPVVVDMGVAPPFDEMGLIVDVGLPPPDIARPTDGSDDQ